MIDRGGKRVLVTGAGGFVGSHLVERLLDYGYQVRCFVRYTSSSRYGRLEYLPSEKRSKVELIAGDLRDAESVSRAAEHVDITMHLGALVGIPYSYLNPREVVETNVTGTLNALIASRKSGVGKLVYISTSEVYGTAQHVPMDEGHALHGQSPYAASKIGAEKLVESFHASYDLPTVVIRPFNMYGPRQSARAVIPTIIAQALTRSEISMGSTGPTRDFTYVTDTVEAIIRAAEVDPAVGRALNVGSGFEISIAELTELICRLVGRGVKPIRQQDVRTRPDNSEVRRLCADASLAHEVLGWEPKVSLEDGLRQTIGWIEAHLDQYHPDRYDI